MQSSAQSLSQLAKAFRDTARDNQNLPVLTKNSTQQCLEFFFDNSNSPNFVIRNGKIDRNSIPQKTSCFCLVGDDGPILIQLFGATIYDRRGDWEMPDLDYSDLQSKANILTQKAQSFYAGIY